MDHSRRIIADVIIEYLSRFFESGWIITEDEVKRISSGCWEDRMKNGSNENIRAAVGDLPSTTTQASVDKRNLP